ncbi:MAG: endonuclease/exonuclease/phosphatase family protein [Myxococcaceae bacterium]
MLPSREEDALSRGRRDTPEQFHRGPDASPAGKKMHVGWLDARWARWSLTTLLVLSAGGTILGVVLHNEVIVGTAFTFARWWLAMALLLCATWFALGRRRSRALGAAAALLLSLGDWTAHALEQARPVVPDKPIDLTVLTFNVLFKGGAPDLAMKVLKENPADVIALQEVTSEWEERLEAQLPARYPYRSVLAQKDGRGLAIYSRYPLETVIPLDDARGKRFAQCAEVKLPTKYVTLCNVHLDSPAGALIAKDDVLGKLRDNARMRRRQWEQLSAHLALMSPGRSRVIAGDFNTMEEDPLYRDIADSWVDAYRSVTLAKGETWPNLGWKPTLPSVRIDYVFVKGPGLPIRSRVIAGGGSDHFPVVTQLAL